MKGFVKTLEALLASIIIFAVLYQFTAPHEMEPWSKIYAHREMEDLLSALSLTNRTLNYVMNNDWRGFHSSLESMLVGPYDFSIEIIGLPKPIVKVGCVCNKTNIERLNRTLEPLEFKYNGRGTEIRIKNGTLEGLANSDVIVFYNQTKIDEGTAERYLKRGIGIVLISNDTDSVDDLFDLSDVSKVEGNAHFNSSVSSMSYHISRIFTLSPFRVLTHGSESEQTGNITLQKTNYEIKTFDNDTCHNCVEYPVGSGKYYEIGENFSIPPYAIYVENVNGNASYGETFADLEIMNKTYEFNIDGSGKSSSHSVLYNDGNAFATVRPYGKAYASWIVGEYNYSDIDELTKAVILFTAVEKYKLDGSTFSPLEPEKVPGKEYFSLDYFLPGLKVLEPFIVRVYVWHIFV